MACRTVAKTSLVHKFTQVLLNAGEERIWRDDRPVLSPKLRSRRRSKLERDIERLRERLQQELDLQLALENAISPTEESCFSQNVPQHLPVDARDLLAEVAVLEMAVSNLEEQMVELQAQIQQERHEYIRSSVDCTTEDPSQIPSTLASRLKDRRTIDEYTIVRQVDDSLTTNYEPQYVESCSSDASSTRGEEEGDGFEDSQLLKDFNHMIYEDRGINRSIQGDVVDGQYREAHLQQDYRASGPHKIENLGQLFSLEDNDNQHLRRLMHGESLWSQPNKLSEEMVSCMIGIYCHLADPSEAYTGKPVVPDDVSSPRSPFGRAATLSSSSSVSELSSLAFMRGPTLAEPYKKDTEAGQHLVDPYGIMHDNLLPWADTGPYKSAVEVSWMSVGNDQLEFAADALKEFRSLVEQLSKVDVACMTHEEKLAFWINVYNALMMHAYLAYGVPKSDTKFLSLIQKAAYTVGGEVFNAMTIEHVLLRVKAPSYRPQIALLLALHNLHIPGGKSRFAISRPEPLVSFALSCGAFSSPAVRIYRAENVQAQLQGALQEYVRASVSVSKHGKWLVPKLLHVYVRDLTMEPGKSNSNNDTQRAIRSAHGGENAEAIVQWICRAVPETEAFLLRHPFHELMHRQCHHHCHHRHHHHRCQHMAGRRASRHCPLSKISALPFDLRFRYLFFVEHHQHQDLQHQNRHPNYVHR